MTLLLVAGGLATALPPAASAQAPALAGADTQAAPPATSEEIDALVATLEDPAERDRLIAQLKLLKRAEAPAAEPAEPEGASLLDLLSQRIEQVSTAMVAAGTALLEAPQQLGDAADHLSRPMERRRLIEGIVKVALVLGPAGLAQWLIGRLLARPWRSMEAGRLGGAWRRAVFILLRFVLRLVPIVTFGVIAYVAMAAFDLRPVALRIALAAVNATLVAATILAVARSVLSPRIPQLRLLPLSDESAAYGMIWAWRFVLLAVYGYALTSALIALRAPSGLMGALERLIGFLVAALAVVLILQNRTAVAAWLRRGRDLGGLGRIRRGLADIWHILAIVLIVCVFLVWAIGVEGGPSYLARALGLSALVLVAARLVALGLERGSRRLFALSHELKDDFPGLETRANRYLPLLQNVLLGALGVAVVLLLLQVWGVPTFAWLASDSGRAIVGTIVKIALIVLVAIVASELVSSLIARYLTRKSRLGEPLARSARVRTLLPLLRNAFRLVLGILVTLIVLSELGIDIAPLLAGAGVIGLAIGFGAQTLVQDVITGIFILAEDTISIGDVVEVGEHSGTVEAMSVRSLRLRDGAGAVHTIPFSQVKTVRNLTRDFAFAEFAIAVSYRTDIDEVITALREIGEQLQADEKLGHDIVQPIEIIGLDQFATGGPVIKARIKTKPMRQWDVSRAFNRRLKQAFDARGIEFADQLARTLRLAGEPSPAPPAMAPKAAGAR